MHLHHSPSSHMRITRAATRAMLANNSSPFANSNRVQFSPTNSSQLADLMSTLNQSSPSNDIEQNRPGPSSASPSVQAPINAAINSIEILPVLPPSVQPSIGSSIAASSPVTVNPAANIDLPPATVSLANISHVLSAAPSQFPAISNTVASVSHAQPSDNVNHGDISLQEINNEIARLEARERLLQIRERVARAEADSSAFTQRAYKRKIRLTDVEPLVAAFTGDDNYSISKWLIDFESVLTSLSGDADDFYRMGRSLLKGTAAIYLRTIRATDWACLRTALIQRFHRQVTYYEVFEKLRARIRLPSESLLHYVTCMQEIAQFASVPEIELVSLIIAGLRDTTGYVSILAGASTVDNLIALIPAYERTVALSRTTAWPRSPHVTTHASQTTTRPAHQFTATQQPLRPTPSVSQPASVNVPSSTIRIDPAVALAKANMRCFNCSRFGHGQGECLQPRRMPGSCFTCGATDHMRANCPRRRFAAHVGGPSSHNNNQIITEPPPEFDLADLTNAISEMPSVSVSFNIGLNNFSPSVNLDALFDTGSEISFVRQSALPSELNCIANYSPSNYFGLGGTPIPTCGTVKCFVRLRHRLKLIRVSIVPDEFIPVSLLLGRDTLLAFNIALHFSPLHILKLFNSNLSFKEKINKCIASEMNIKDFDSKNTPSTDSANCNSVNGIVNTSVNQLGPSEATITPVIDNLDQSNDPSDPAMDFFQAFIELPSAVDDYGTIDNHLNDSVPTDKTKQLISDFDINPNLPQDLNECIQHCISLQYIQVPQAKIKPLDYKMSIHLTDSVPFSARPRRLSYTDKTEVRKMVQSLLDEGVIRPSESPYASPIVLVKKKNGTIRMCIDYRALNNLTVRDNYPLPLIEDCLDYLNNKQFFSLLDLKSGFHQIPIDDKSIKYTAFVTPDGQYEYTHMPFGLKNAPSVFQRYICRVLKPFIDQGKIVVYLDDILLATSTMDEHITLLSEVLRTIAEHNLILQSNKCQFAYQEMEYLGFRVTPSGISPGTLKSKAIDNFPIPKDAKAVHSFIGLCSYFRKFIANFAQVANPLYRLLRANVPFVWNEDCIRAFEKLKTLLTSSPVLCIYDPKKETELHTDASKLGFGAILMQKQSDGKFHPVAFFSKTATECESRYNSYELETLAIVYALDRWRVYLSGIRFTIISDCHSLVETFSKRDVNPRIQRWVWEFQRFSLRVRHRSGSKMPHVDSLSRNPIICLVHPSDLQMQLCVTQARDPILKNVRDSLTNSDMPPFELINGLVYRKSKEGRSLFCVPSEMEQQLIAQVHDRIGHFGADKCFDNMKQRYWFPSMRQKIDIYVQNCVKCIVHSAPNRPSEHALYSIPKKPLPFDTIHIDHFGPLPSVISKQKHLLVATDAFTKFTKLYPATSTSTKEVCRTLDKYFKVYSRPARIVHDGGSCVTSAEFTEFLQHNNIQDIRTAVASPQANGQVERINRILKSMLGKLTEPIKHSDWTKQIEHVEYAINNTLQKSIGTTPSKLLFGINQKGPDVDYLSEFLEEVDDTVERDLEAFRTKATKSIARSQKYSQKWFDEHCKPAKNYTEGDYVVIRNVDTSAGTNKKFLPKFRGPYMVHRVLRRDRYVVRDIDNFQLTRIPYSGVIEAKNMKLWKKRPIE